MTRICQRTPSPAMAVALVALFIALGGSAYAAIGLSRNSVLSSHIKNGQVKQVDLGTNVIDSRKVEDGALRGSDFRRGDLPPGPAGPPGAQGRPGPAGAPASTLWANVRSNGTLIRGRGVTATRSSGSLHVTFDRNIESCVFFATPGENNLGWAPQSLAITTSAPNELVVRSESAVSVYVAVLC